MQQPHGYQKPQTDLSKTETVGTTRWLRLETLTYTDQTGQERKWDRAVRTTRPDEDSLDAVAIVATLRHPSLEDDKSDGSNLQEEEILLVKQFRPAVNCHTIELPAGLVDAGESPSEAALRELKEETGFAGSCRVTGSAVPSFPLSPGLSNENFALVLVDVDMSLKENKNPVQMLERGEFCQVLRVKKRDLLGELTRLMREDPDIKVFGALWTLAVGMDMAISRA